MDAINIILERHDQRLKTLERDISDLREVQNEIRSMNETLVTLATELKHTNEHLARLMPLKVSQNNGCSRLSRQLLRRLPAALYPL